MAGMTRMTRALRDILHVSLDAFDGGLSNAYANLVLSIVWPPEAAVAEISAATAGPKYPLTAEPNSMTMSELQFMLTQVQTGQQKYMQLMYDQQQRMRQGDGAGLRRLLELTRPASSLWATLAVSQE